MHWFSSIHYRTAVTTIIIIHGYKFSPNFFRNIILIAPAVSRKWFLIDKNQFTFSPAQISQIIFFIFPKNHKNFALLCITLFSLSQFSKVMSSQNNRHFEISSPSKSPARLRRATGGIEAREKGLIVVIIGAIFLDLFKVLLWNALNCRHIVCPTLVNWTRTTHCWPHRNERRVSLFDRKGMPDEPWKKFSFYFTRLPMPVINHFPRGNMAPLRRCW